MEDRRKRKAVWLDAELHQEIKHDRESTGVSIERRLDDLVRKGRKAEKIFASNVEPASTSAQ